MFAGFWINLDCSRSPGAAGHRRGISRRRCPGLINIKSQQAADSRASQGKFPPRNRHEPRKPRLIKGPAGGNFPRLGGSYAWKNPSEFPNADYDSGRYYAVDRRCTWNGITGSFDYLRASSHCILCMARGEGNTITSRCYQSQHWFSRVIAVLPPLLSRSNGALCRSG